MGWLSIIFFVLSNGPSVLRLIIEIRGLIKDLNASEKKAVMEMCREDLESFKADKDEVKLMSAIKEKKVRFKTMQGEKPRGRKDR